MLILVAVTVSIVVESDIITTAETAGETYKTKQSQEQIKTEDVIIEGENVRYNTLEEYVENILYSGGSGAVELITFTIDETTYQAEKGMKWEKWCNSSYNTGDFKVEFNYVRSWNGHDIWLQGSSDYDVLSTDSIVPGGAYSILGGLDI